MSLFTKIVADNISVESISTHYAKQRVRRNEFAKSRIGRSIMALQETCCLMFRRWEKKTFKE